MIHTFKPIIARQASPPIRLRLENLRPLVFALKIKPTEVALVLHHIIATFAVMIRINAKLVSSPANMKMEESANVNVSSMARVLHLSTGSNAVMTGTIVNGASRLLAALAVDFCLSAFVIVARTILVHALHITDRIRMSDAMFEGTIAREATRPRTIGKTMCANVTASRI